MRICSRLEKMVLAALVMEIRSTKKPNAHIQDVYRRLVSHVFILCPLMPGVFQVRRVASCVHPSNIFFHHLPLLCAQRETTAVSSGTVCRVVHGMVSSHLLACDHHWKVHEAALFLRLSSCSVLELIFLRMRHTLRVSSPILRCSYTRTT